MYYALAAFAAFLIAVMVAVNGELNAFHGLHLTNLIIHVVGLICISAAALVKRERVFRVKVLPLALFTGGVIGYFTTLFNNMAVGRISVTAILALSLLGQAATSLVIDQFGLFDMPRRSFGPRKLPGLIMTCVGIAFLLWGGERSAFVPALVSLLTGITVVTSRQVNGQLTARTSELTATFWNYLTGLCVCAAALGVAALSGAEIVPFNGFEPRLWTYLGGAIGAVIIMLSNLCVHRMSSLIMTLIMFAGQVFGGVAIDAAFFQTFSPQTLAGGLFAFLGLVVNTLLDGRSERESSRA